MSTPTRTRLALVGGVLALALVAGACSSTAAADRAASTTASTTAPASAPGRSKVETLRADMRKLWEDHITWTRMYIVSAEAGSPDTDATAQRLLQNQTDIGDAIKPLYGDAAGAELTALLREHILIAGQIIVAAKSNDATKVGTTKDAWYANADQIADFLAKANPDHWPAAEMRQMMHDHLDNTLAEAVDHLEGHFAADIADYDKVHGQILHMADMLSDGIVAQFPKQFS